MKQIVNEAKELIVSLGKLKLFLVTNEMQVDAEVKVIYENINKALTSLKQKNFPIRARNHSKCR